MKKLAISIYVFFAVVAAAICGAGYYFGRHIPFAQQWPLYEALRTTAAIIFAVVGAWLAIVYPERLKFSFDQQPSRQSTHKKSNRKNFELLFVPAIHSTVILIVLLLSGIIAPLLKQVAWEPGSLEIIRGLSYFLVSGLTLWQIAIVAMAIAPVEMLMGRAAQEEVQEKIDRRFRPEGRRQLPRPADGGAQNDQA
ncbi:hypothetical protein [Achromobacter sp.]|uniref:hypothetical protein n=1 Tax=Achromobacter sp. TaxID=134375 RepID=UPI0028AB8416|nr:hypothetical protein [Achromobacter sp.]